MAFAPIAPWINQNDPLASMRAGASLGAELRGQDIQSSEAGDRLRLAYTQLASEEKMRDKEAQTRNQLAAVSLAMKQQQIESQAQHRAQLEQLAQQRINDLGQYRNALTIQRAATDELKKRNIHFAPNGQVLKVNDDGTVDELRPGNEKPEKKPTVRVPLSEDPFGPTMTGASNDPEIMARLKAIGQTKTAPSVAPTGFSLLHPGTWFGRGAAPSAGSPPSGAPLPAAPSASPFKEGQLIRSKKDPSKVFRVQNGVPVPVDADTNEPATMQD